MSDFGLLEILLVLAAWLFFAGVAGVIAERKGRSRVEFFGLSLLLSPLVGITAALMATPNAERAERMKVGKKCPHCAELVKYEARVCRYCARDLPEKSVVESSDADRLRFSSREEYEAWKRGQQVNAPGERRNEP